MQQPDISNVRPLIAHEQLNGHTISFIFACPVSGDQVTGTHTIKGEASVGSHVAAKAKRAAMLALRGPVASAVRSAFGTSSVIGRFVGDVASTAAYVAAAPRSQGASAAFSQKQRDQAAVTAFMSVAGEFEWDSRRSRWVSTDVARELASPFQRQLTGNPLTTAYDRELSARMLVEIARADGSIASEETEFLREFLDANVGSVELLSACPRLTAAELGQATEGPVRVTLMSLAWVLALSSDQLDPSEETRLEEFARALELGPEESLGARAMAQGYLVELCLAANGTDSATGRSVAQSMADTIEMSSDEFDVVEARFRKRQSLSTSS